MKRLAGLLSAAVIAAVSSAALAQAPAAAPETNADMARGNQAQAGHATKAERQAARKKRLAGTGTPETNAAMAKDAEGKGGKAKPYQVKQVLAAIARLEGDKS